MARFRIYGLVCIVGVVNTFVESLPLQIWEHRAIDVLMWVTSLLALEIVMSICYRDATHRIAARLRASAPAETWAPLLARGGRPRSKTPADLQR